MCVSFSYFEVNLFFLQVTDICKMVDAELGYADSVPVFRESSKVCGVGWCMHVCVGGSVYVCMCGWVSACIYVWVGQCMCVGVCMCECMTLCVCVPRNVR